MLPRFGDHNIQEEMQIVQYLSHFCSIFLTSERQSKNVILLL